MISENDMKKQLVDIARRCSRRNFQTGDGGNISVRFGEDRMLIMASRSSFSDCTEDSFILTGFRGETDAAPRRPSRECILHGAIYSKFPKVRAIIHCHAPYSTAWASTMQPLPVATYHSKIKLNGRLKVFDTGNYIVSEKEVEAIINSYAANEDVKGFLLKKHGAFALGDSLVSACYTMELIEETAKIGIYSSLLASPGINLV